MDILTLYVGQGALTGIRVGNEGILVDSHMPETDQVTAEEIQQGLSIYFRNITVRGLILTGFDADHAQPIGVEWILSKFTLDWIMYRNISRIQTLLVVCLPRSTNMTDVAQEHIAR